MISLIRFQTLLLVVALGGAAACDKGPPPPPPTFPVKGKVIFLEGGSPADGMIEFRSLGSDSISARGKVEKDGSFVLSCIASNKTLEGAVEGEHTVTYIPDFGAQGAQSTLQPSVAADKYKVKPEPNDITVKVAKPRPPS